MTKREALELVHALRMSVLLGLVLHESCNPDLTASIIRGQQFGFARGGKIEAALQLNVLADALQEATDRQVVLTNLQLLLKHALVRNTFEVVKAYAEDTGQGGKFKGWQSYDFARLVRNTLSHRNGALLHQWSPPALASAKWRHRTLTPRDVGTFVTLEPAEYVMLQEDLYDFLKSGLA